MKQQFIRQGGVHILYDSDAAPQFSPDWFAPDTLSHANACERVAQGGRVPALFFTQGDDSFVLKRYHRGGWLGRCVRNTYCYAGEAAVRSFHEWRLLAELQRLSLPAPAPCAARYRRQGMCYTADLITLRLHAQPLSQVLIRERLLASRWRALGAVLRRFHDAGVYHADLNAHNILIGDGEHDFFVVDFDKARIIAAAKVSRFTGNLKRLRRSLLKLKTQSSVFMYEDKDFSELAGGYYSG